MDAAFQTKGNQLLAALGECDHHESWRLIITTIESSIVAAAKANPREARPYTGRAKVTFSTPKTPAARIDAPDLAGAAADTPQVAAAGKAARRLRWAADAARHAGPFHFDH